ncbi:secreted protein [Streptomyces sp. SPB074]|nr:secreted protein [Streptomyces sp. SPB074]
MVARKNEIHTDGCTSPGRRNVPAGRAFSSAPRGDGLRGTQEDEKVINFKKAATVTLVAGGLLAAGTGMASATDCPPAHGGGHGGHHAPGHGGHHGGNGGGSHAGGGAHANGAAIGSPGILSSNLVQVPVNIPVNVSGNTINVIGLLNPAFGNTAVNR